jgi:hypothetical protein
MNTDTLAPGDRDIRTVSVGLFRSRRKGEILLVYLNDGEADATILLYNQLSRKERQRVHAAAQDPLSVLKRTHTTKKASRWAA